MGKIENAPCDKKRFTGGMNVTQSDCDERPSSICREGKVDLGKAQNLHGLV
jgi:hypothetical protein